MLTITTKVLDTYKHKLALLLLKLSKLSHLKKKRKRGRRGGGSRSRRRRRGRWRGGGWSRRPCANLQQALLGFVFGCGHKRALCRPLGLDARPRDWQRKAAPAASRLVKKKSKCIKISLLINILIVNIFIFKPFTILIFVQLLFAPLFEYLDIKFFGGQGHLTIQDDPWKEWPMKSINIVFFVECICN